MTYIKVMLMQCLDVYWMPYVSRLLYLIINQSLSPKYYLQLATEISRTQGLNIVKPSSFESTVHQIFKKNEEE